MDLNIPRFERIEEVAPLPAEIASIVVDVAANGAIAGTPANGGGAISPMHAAIPAHRLFTPVDGAFNGRVAAEMTRWKGP